MKTVTVAEAETHFSALLADVEENNESIIVLREGKKVARLLPIDHRAEDPIGGGYRDKLEIKLAPLAGSSTGTAAPLAMFRFDGIQIAGDIGVPANSPEDWEYD